MPSPIKIAHIIPNLVKGGAQRLVIDICNELIKRKNIQVKLIVLSNENEFEELSKNIDIVYCNSKITPSIIKKDTIDIIEYEKIIDDFRPHIIHSHLYIAEIVSRENVRKNTIYFTHCHNKIEQLGNLNKLTLFQKSKITNYYEKLRLIKKYIEAKNNFICISNDTVNYFKIILPKKLKNNTILFPNAINIDSFFNNYYLPINEKIKLINVGNLLPNKNQTFLLDVVKYLINKKINAELYIVGNGEKLEHLTEKTIKLKLEDNVIFTGSIDNIDYYLKQSNIFIHAALSEAFGLVLIEAMAAGLPIISLNGKGNKDIIIEGKNGFLINQANPSIFAERIIELATNKELHKRMSDFCKEYAKQFDIKIYIDNLLTLYRNKLN